MNKKEILSKMVEETNGYLLTSMAKENNISRTYLSQFVKQQGMEKVAQGIYITDDVWPDELFIMQTRNPTVIFSGETALYLHGLIDREYSKICITVPTGYNATRFKTENVLVKYVSRDMYSMGITSVLSSSGNAVKVYDKERCICELVKQRKKVEIQSFQIAVKDYMAGKKKICRI